MHILFDHSIFIIQRYGGISRYFAELIPRLAKLDDTEVSLFMGAYLNRYPLPQARSELRHYFGFRRPDIRKTHQIAARLCDAMFSMAIAAWKPAVYHATGYENRILGRSFRGSRVITIHDMIPQRTPQFFPGASRDFQAKKHAASLADGIICVSESTRRDVIELLGVAEEKTTVIYHGNSLTLRPSGRQPYPRPFLLFVGGREGYKNFLTLLAAWSRNNHLAMNYDIVCFGASAFTAQEQEAIAKSFRPSGVIRVGGDDQVLADLYDSAAAFVYPSLYEGFGMPLLEAMYHECPVVAARASCFPEVAGDAAAYFDPDKPDELAEVLGKVVENTDYRGTLIKNGLQQHTRFDWDICAKQTRAFYDRVTRMG